MAADHSDEQLAAAWQHGDARAGTTLLGRHVRSLDRYFWTKVGRQEAEDLRQETLVRASTAIAGFRHRSSFRTYLFRIAHRTLCDHLRYLHSGRGRRDTATCSLEQLHGAIESRTELDDRAWDLVAALRSLSADDQILFELRELEGLSYAEIAAVMELDCAVATLRARVHGIRKVLQAKLSQGDERWRDADASRGSAAPVSCLDHHLARVFALLQALCADVGQPVPQVALSGRA